MRPLLLAALLAAGPATGQSHGGQSHGGHDMAGTAGEAPPGGAAVLSEPGQGAFAALAEVVARLEADPDTDTDWTRVDLRALRDHLIDMDRVVRDAEASAEPVAGGLRATVTGDEATAAALRRMVPAHAAELSRDPHWSAVAEPLPDGAVLTVTGDDPGTVERIRALGFFGLMASQDHHRAHHWAIATGRPAH